MKRRHGDGDVSVKEFLRGESSHQNLGETLGVKVAQNLAETESCRQLLAGRVSQHPLITHHIPHTPQPNIPQHSTSAPSTSHRLR